MALGWGGIASPRSVRGGAYVSASTGGLRSGFKLVLAYGEDSTSPFCGKICAVCFSYVGQAAIPPDQAGRITIFKAWSCPWAIRSMTRGVSSSEHDPLMK